MPRRDQTRSALGFWRVVALVIATGLGLAAVCLVVFGNSQKQLQIGVLLGLWGGLIGAFLVFGSRRSQAEQTAQLAETEYRANKLYEAQLQVSQLQQAQLEGASRARARQELELRKMGEVQLSREVAARREADLNLEISLRREIEKLMAEHIGSLRDEVAALRAEVVEKLGGELRLERIETTRLIGSDLEALQYEIRRLAGSQPGIASAPLSQVAPDDAGSALPMEPSGNPGRRREDVADIIDAEVIEAGHAVPAEQPAEPVEWTTAFEPTPAREPAAQAAEPTPPPMPADPPALGVDPLTALVPVAPVAEPKPVSVPPLYRQSEQVAAFTSSFDPFAGLPRLSPLPEDVELIADEPIADEPPEQSSSSLGTPAGGGRRRAPDDEPSPTNISGGRRRAPDDANAGIDEQPSGGHRRASDESHGRRRAPDDAPDDLMARLTDR